MIDAPIAGMMAVSAVVTYFVCGIPFGLVIAAKQGNIDVRKVGSGNIGTTNVARSVGAKAAAFTLALDVLKGFLSTFVWERVFAAVCFGGDMALVSPYGAYGWMVSVVFLFAILGHVFSPYLRFHGGKGIAVGFGAALGYIPLVALGLLAVFFVAAIPTRYVSLGSCCAAAALPVCAILAGYAPATVVPLVAVGAIVVWAHRSNIAKLAKGEERRFAFRRPEKDGR